MAEKETRREKGVGNGRRKGWGARDERRKTRREEVGRRE